MQPVKLFLAASKEEELAAEAFRFQLIESTGRAQIDVEVYEWFPDRRFPGQNYIDSLIKHCIGREGSKPSDFFAAIITNNEENLRARLLELGLFLGGLGFEPQRCFLLLSSDDVSLPSPLQGQSYIAFKPPLDRADAENWADAMSRPAALVRDRIKQLRAFAHVGFEVLNAEQLMDLEAPIGDSETSHLEREAEVVINRSQPIEESQSGFSTRVLYNMKRGVKYRYFFHDKEAFGSIARLLYALATAGQDDEGVRKYAAGTNTLQSPVIDNLQVMRRQLSINLIPSPGPIEFCIHNVQNPGLASCYLRYPFSGNFIKWCDRQGAVHIARELMDLALMEDDLDQLFVLRSTKDFDLNSQENQSTKKRLWNAIRQRFGDEKLNQILREVCFERLTDDEIRQWSEHSLAPLKSKSARI